MPIMLKKEWDAWMQRSRDEMTAHYALRDLIVISNFVDEQGRTMTAEGAVRLLSAAGMPNSIPIELMWTSFR